MGQDITHHWTHHGTPIVNFSIMPFRRRHGASLFIVNLLIIIVLIISVCANIVLGQSRNADYDQFSAYANRRQYRGPNPGEPNLQGTYDQIKVVGTNVGVISGQMLNGQNLGDFVQLVGINNNNNVEVPDLGGLIQVVRIGSGVGGAEPPVKIPVVSGPSLGSRETLPDQEARSKLSAPQQKFSEPQYSSLNAELQSTPKEPQRLPYDRPYFVPPGQDNQSGQGHLYSLEDIHGRPKHQVQYYVGEKAEEMKKAAAKVQEHESIVYGLPAVRDDNHRETASASENVYHISPQIHLPGHGGVINPGNPKPYKYVSELHKNLPRVHINPQISLPGQQGVVDMSSVQHPQVTDHQQQSKTEQAGNSVHQYDDPPAAFFSNQLPNIISSSKVQYQFASEEPVPVTTVSDTTASASRDDFAHKKVVNLPTQQQIAQFVAQETKSVTSIEESGHSLVEDLPAPPNPAAIKSVDSQAAGSEQNFISIFADRGKKADRPRKPVEDDNPSSDRAQLNSHSNPYQNLIPDAESEAVPLEGHDNLGSLNPQGHEDNVIPPSGNSADYIAESFVDDTNESNSETRQGDDFVEIENAPNLGDQDVGIPIEGDTDVRQETFSAESSTQEGFEGYPDVNHEHLDEDYTNLKHEDPDKDQRPPSPFAAGHELADSPDHPLHGIPGHPFDGSSVHSSDVTDHEQADLELDDHDQEGVHDRLNECGNTSVGGEGELVVNPEADVFIGVVLPLSSAGGRASSCGGLEGEWVAALEALKWGVARINQNRGQVGRRILLDSYIPGLQFGLRVYDSCGQRPLALAALQSLYPQLRGVGCSSAPPLHSIAVLDLGSEAEQDVATQELLGQHSAPLVPAAPSTLVPPSQRAIAIVKSLAALEWSSVLLLTASDQYSMEQAKVVTSLSGSHNVCVSAVEVLPALSDPSNGSPRPTPSSVGEQFRAAVERIVDRALQGGVLGVVVIATGASLDLTLDALLSSSSDPSFPPLPWLLSSLPEPGVGRTHLGQLVVGGLPLWLLTLSPPLEEFEYHWSDLQEVAVERSPENDWLLQYLQQENNCSLIGVLNTEPSSESLDECLALRGVPLDGLSMLGRTRAVVASLHGLFTAVNAVRSAWKLKCTNKPGLCDALSSISLQDFTHSALTPLGFLHDGPGARTPPELKGGKAAHDPLGRLAGASMGVYRLVAGDKDETREKENITATLVLEVEEGGAVVRNVTLLEPPSASPQCEGLSCGSCARSVPQPLPPLSAVAATPAVIAEPHILLPSPQSIYVAGLFPVHQPSEDGTGCGPLIQPEALQEVEALLWAVEQINRHQQLLPDTRLGVLVLDTCGAQIRATNQVTNLIKGTLPGINIPLENIHSFITALDLDTAKVVGEMLASVNITSINLGQSLAHSPFALQMSPPPNLEAEAMVQVLRYLGWDFVSLLVSADHPESSIGASALHTVARAARVCVGLELTLRTSADEQRNADHVDQLVSRLAHFSSDGGRAVLLFLSSADTVRLLQAIRRAEDAGQLQTQQLVLLSSTSWGDNTDQIPGDDAPAGSLLLKDGQQDVQDFSLHYRLLTPDNNTRNPWFRPFWKQEFGCSEPSCHDPPRSPPVLPYRPTPPTPRVVQAVFSFAAALTQLLQHLCPHAEGAMCPGLARWRRRTVLNEFLRNTEVSRVDKPKEFFQFTENFHGNAPLQVLNLQRVPVSSPNNPSSKEEDNLLETTEARYVQVGRYFNSALSLSGPTGGYSNGSWVPLSSLPSSCTASCAASCTHHDTDYLFVESRDRLYIVAALNVHQPGDKPLECGPLRGDQGIQEVEAFLWALSQVNEGSKAIAGLSEGTNSSKGSIPHLGAVIFDGCSSKEKIVRDVTNLLTGRVQERIRQMLPSSSHIVGVVVGGRGPVAQQVLDLTQPYGITSVATLASHTDLANTRRFPALIRFAAGNDVTARALAALLHHWGWTLFSVVYSDGGAEGDVAKHLLREAALKQLWTAVAEPVPLQVSSPEYLLGVWGRLAEGAQQGSRAVVLLLQPQHLVPLLLAGETLKERGLLRQGDFVFLMTSSPAPFLPDPSSGLNTLVVRPALGPVPQFADHFLGLSLLNHTSPYPWFAEFWAQVFGCQGAGCLTGPRQTLGAVTRHLRIAEGVGATTEAVHLLAKALRSTLDQLCDQDLSGGACNSLLTDPLYRETLFRAAQRLQGHLLDDQPYAFARDGHNTEAVLQVFNFREVGQTRLPSLVKVGEFGDRLGLALNTSMVLSYDSRGDPRPMSDVQSRCTDITSCGGGRAVIEDDEPDDVPIPLDRDIMKKQENGYAQMYPEQRFGISGMIPIHKQGKNFFSCGDFYGESIFQNLAAVAYALNQINENTVGVGLGAIFFDYCDRTERAREQMFSFYAGDATRSDESIILTPDRIVASLSFDDDAAESVSTILSSNYIPHFSSPVAGIKRDDRTDDSVISSVPSRTAELHVYISLLKKFNWKYVSVIFDNDSTGKYLAKTFKKYTKKEHICIGDTFGVHKLVSEEYAQELIEALTIEWKPRIVVLLVDDANNIRTLLEVAQKLGKGDTFLFLAGTSWGNKEKVAHDLHDVGAGALTFTLETYDLPDFRMFVSNLTLDHHYPIPEQWFNEYYQNQFECHLPDAVKSLTQFKTECDGSEKIHADDIIQDPFVFHTILSVNAIAHGLDSYIRKQCKNVKTIDDCTVVQAELLLEIAYHGKISLNNTDEASPYTEGRAYGFHIWNFREISGDFSYMSAGKWENGVLSIQKENVRFKTGDSLVPDSSCREGLCLEVCSSQSPVYAALRLPQPLPIDINFRNVYGITTSTLSLLGIIVILVTIVYFMMSFPTAAGTSVLGYMILTGCLILYATNFAFIFQPTIGTCAVRRFLMGFGYAVKFSAMLVKVLHTWRLASYADEEDYISFTRPGVLFVVATSLSMVQVVLGAAWLILYPPAVDLEGETWRCTPAEHFESDLVISLVYVMVLIAATILFSIETWQNEENSKETRWILLSSLCCSVVWLIWTIVATKAAYYFRDPAIVIANLVCATTTLLFLYARKLYLTSQLSKDVRDLELRSHFTAASSIYNASLAAQKMGEDSGPRLVQQVFRDPPKEDLDEDRNLPGRQFVGEQEVSFRTVTLPPETPMSRRSGLSKSSSRTSRTSTNLSRTPSRRSLGLNISDELPNDLNFDIFESSEEDFILDAHNFSSDEGGSDGRGRREELGDPNGVRGALHGGRVAGLENRGPSIRRVGSRQMLVFLTDGNSIGDVSRI